VGSVGPPRADASHAGVFPFCDCVHSWAWRNINREIEFRIELSYNHCGVDLDVPVEMEKYTLPVTGVASCALRIGASDRPFDDIATSTFSRPPRRLEALPAFRAFAHGIEVGNGEQIELKAILRRPRLGPTSARA
jgi:hypothetical protein